MNKYPFTVDSKIYKDPQSSNSDGSSQRIIKVVITLDDQSSNMKNNYNNEQHNFHANLNHHEDNSSAIKSTKPILTISSSYVRESPPHNYPKKNYTLPKKPKLVEQISQYEEKIESEDSESNETQSPRRLGPPSFNSPSYKKSFNIDKSIENQDYNSNSDNFTDLSPKATKIDQRKKKSNIFSRTLRTSNENSQISSIKQEIPENFVQIKREEKKKFNYTQQINSQKATQNLYKKQKQNQNPKKVFNQRQDQFSEEDSDDIINEPPKVPIIFRSHKTRKAPVKEKPYFSTSTIPIDNDRTEKAKKNEKRINRKILRIPTVNDDLPIFHQDPPKAVNTQKVISHDEHPILIEEEEEIQDENEDEVISFAPSANDQNHDNIRRKIDFTDIPIPNQKEEQKLTNLNSSGLIQKDNKFTNLNSSGLNQKDNKLTNLNSSGLNQKDNRLTNLNSSGLNQRKEQKLTNLNSSGLNQKDDNKLINSNAGCLNQNEEFNKLDFDDSNEEEDLLVSDQEDEDLNENENFNQNKDENYNTNNFVQGKTANKLTIEPIEINSIFDKSYQQKNRFSKIENQLIFDEDPDDEFDQNKVDNDHSVNSTKKPGKFTFNNQASLNINSENEERLLNNPPAKEKVINVTFDNYLSDENKNNFENSQEAIDQTQTVISSPIKGGVSIDYSPIKKMENDEIENDDNNKVSSLTTKENDDKKDDNFWMFIPVDKKKHKKEINITQNMSKVVNVSRNYVKGVQAFRSLSMLLNQHRYEHFIMNLDKENQKLIGIYTLNDRMNQIKKIWGDGPEKATLDDVNSSLLYNPSSKKFSNLDPSFTQDVDAVYLK